MERADGLIDTGATATAIRADLAAALRLKPSGRRRVYTANGDIMATEYIFRIGLYPGDFGDDSAPDLAAMPYVLERTILGFDLSERFHFPMLIGMDILAQGDLAIFRDGSASLDIA